jgi:CHAD domain-containing protein
VSLPDARGALAAELAHARSLLEGRRAVDDRTAHALRRSMKRARTLLRLLRETAGKPAFRRENRALRDAARSLAPLREARVLLQTLAGLGALRHPALALLRRAAAAALRRPPPAAPLDAVLAACAERTGRWRPAPAARPALAAGLGRIYRRGRKALRRAQARGTEPALHELRKQAKCLGTAIDFLGPAGLEGARKLLARARRVGADLGDAHDLANLARRAHPARLPPALRARLGKRRDKLQRRALEVARALYSEKPKRFADRLPHRES